jgi:outer membrane protein OmpA-like peptidoglycan-associated protein
MSRYLVVTAISFAAFSAVTLATVAHGQSLPSGAFEVAQAPGAEPAAPDDDKEGGERRKKRDGEGGRGRGPDGGPPPAKEAPPPAQQPAAQTDDKEPGERRGRRERGRDGDDDSSGAPAARQAQPPAPPPPAPPPVQQVQPPVTPPTPPAAQRDDDGRGERDRSGPPPVEQAQPPAPPAPPPVQQVQPPVTPPAPPAAQRDDDSRGERRGRGERDRSDPPPAKQAQPPAPPASPPPAAAAPPPPQPQGPGKDRDRRQYGGGAGGIDAIKRGRRQRVEEGGRRTIIEEPGNRTIVQEKGAPPMIRHDEGERMRRTSRDVRTEKRRDGGNLTIAIRPGGIEVFSEFDSAGRLQRRYRRGRDGRETNLIDNRRFRGGGPVILVDLRPPVLRIPRERYIVDYDRASDRDIYDTLEAGPIERLERGYSLDEIRYNAYLRDRMRRIDLDTVNFEFGAWQVPPDQWRRLERMANAINRVLDRRPDEVFLIEGHTDAVGSDIDNLTLSDRRAEEVAIILSDTFRVPPENLVTQGYGEEFLKVPTGGPERLNRRVAVRRITPLLARR